MSPIDPHDPHEIAEDRLDGSGPDFGPEPALRPAHEQVLAGRAALRRRRLALGASGLVAVVALGGGYALLGGPVAEDDATPGPATHATPSPEPSSPAPREPTQSPARSGDVRTASAAEVARRQGRDGIETPAWYDRDQTIVLQPGLRIVKRIDDPLDGRSTVTDGNGDPLPLAGSVALRLERPNGTGYFIELESTRDGGGGSTWDDIGQAHDTLASWLDALASTQAGSDDDQPVRLDPDGTLTPLVDGFRVLDQRRVDGLADYTSPEETTVVAKVRREDGTPGYLLAYRLGDGPATYSWSDPVFTPDDLDGFLAHLKVQARDGEGLR